MLTRCLLLLLLPLIQLLLLLKHCVLQYSQGKHDEYPNNAFSAGRTCKWDKQTCEEAARYGHLNVLQWAHENGCPWTEKTFTKAAEGGSMDICKYTYITIYNLQICLMYTYIVIAV
jgi:hypothetical protein